MALSEKGKQLRKCRAFTLNGYGPRCKHWAERYSNFCNLHNGKIRQHPDERELAFRRIFPRLYKKVNKCRICNCSAYPFPHCIAVGLCRWPDPPTHQLVITENSNNEETKLKKKLRKMGVKISPYKQRTSDVRPIIKHKPEDLTLEEDYLAKKSQVSEEKRTQNGYDDFSSLPIEQKQRIWKEQIVAEFYRQNPRLDKRGYPHTVEVDGRVLRYKVIKDRDEKSWMILETGQKIPLSDEA